MEKNNEAKSRFFETIHKIGKPLDWQRKKREGTIINIKNETEGITRDCSDIKGIIGERHGQLYMHTFHGVDEMDQILKNTNYHNSSSKKLII